MIFEISGDLKRFCDISGVFSSILREKYVKISLITVNCVKKEKNNGKKLLQIENIFVIINPVKL